MPDNCHSAFEDSEDSSKLCYDNFPHYEGIKKEVKEQLVNVTTNKDFGRLLTLLIPSTTNLLLLLYASSEDFLSTARFSSGRPETRNAEEDTAGWSSWGFSSEILRASGRHGELASIVDELWRPSPFGESLTTVTDGYPQSSSPPAATEPLSPAGTDHVPEYRDGSAGVIGDPRDIRLQQGAVKEEETPYVGQQCWQTASYADVAAGRQAATLPARTTTTDSSPRPLVLADFITPKYKKKGRSRKGSSKQNSKTVETPATTDDQLSTCSCTQSADEAASDAVKSQEADGDDSLAEPEVALRSWPPSPPPGPHAGHSVFCWPNETQLSRGGCSAPVFASKVAQLEEAGNWFAERLAVGELQPDPAAIFFQLQQLQQQERDLD